MSAAGLHVARGVTLPSDAITRVFGIFGQRGTGKTNTAVVLVEEIVAAGGHVVIFDPVGAWWGVTHAGSGRGLPGIVLGGRHADVPLEETAGRLVADLVIGRHWPVVVVDTRLLRKGARLRFMADCLEEIYHRNEEPLHVVFEEADKTLPQSPRGMDPTLGRVLGAAEDIAKLGRIDGLGVTVISQRFATVNANVREQIEALVLHTLAGPLDRREAGRWIEANGDPAVTSKILNALPSFDVGQAQLYSPSWLKRLEQVQIRARRTFDSSATPDGGRQEAAPTKRAPVDLDTLKVLMAETVERARANDPRALRARIASLERELAQRPEAEPETIEVPMLSDVEVETLREMAAGLTEVQGRLSDAVDDLRGYAGEIAGRLGEVEDVAARIGEAVERATGQRAAPARPRPAPAAPVASPRAAPRSAPAGGANGACDESLKKAERLVLAVLVQYPEGRTTRQVAILTGYAKNGGGFRNALGRLRSLGYISPAGAEPLTATAEGVAAAGDIEPLPTGRALLDHWLRSLKKAEREVLEVLYAAYPRGLTAEDIAAATPSEYAPSGGGFRNALGKLRTLELVEGYGEIRASDALFD